MLREKNDPIFHLPKHSQNELLFWKKCKKTKPQMTPKKEDLLSQASGLKKSTDKRKPCLRKLEKNKTGQKKSLRSVDKG